MNIPKIYLSLLCLLFLLIDGCTTTTQSEGSENFNRFSHRNHDFEQAPDVCPKTEMRSKYGNPECYNVDGQTYHVMKSAQGYCKTGLASWYGTKFHGRKTSSREPYDMFALTAASRNLPIPTYVEVTNLENGKTIIVKVNDRGPFKSDRIIDLSYAAAHKLGFANKGTANVEVRALNTNTVNTRKDSQRIMLANNDADIPEIQINPIALPKPNQAAKPVTLERYLQLGAYSNKDNAKKMQQKIMTQTDAPVLIKEGILKARSIYRVQIGPFNSVPEAEDIKHKLVADGFDVLTVFS